MVRALALALLLAPALALAQVTVTETSDLDKGNDQIINIQECNGAVASRFAISFKLPVTAGTVSSVDLRISDTSACPLPSTSNTAKTVTLQNFASTSGSLSSNRTAQNLVSLLALTCTAGQLQTLFVCAVGVTGSTDVSNALQTASIQLDTQTPAAPTNVQVGPGDSALEVSWDAVSGATRYKVAAVAIDGSQTKESGIISDTTSFRLGSLQNGKDYSVTVVAYSAGLNPSAASAALTGTPVEVNDFWRLYRKDGGGEQGGCGTPGAGALSILALAALALRRRRRSALPLVLALATLGAALPARAAESKRWGSWDVRFSPYRPNIDGESFSTLDPNVAVPPYQAIFGGGRKLMIRSDVAFSVFRSSLGTLDVGVGAGFWQVRGNGRQSNNGQVSADGTSLRIIPTSLSLMYSFESLPEQTWFPFTPYGRLAFERFNWWVTNGSGGTANASGKSGYGATNGWSATAGLGFLLDVIDRSLARELDNDVGINHTYLFAEATKLRVDDFGSKKSFDLSSSTGITWEFGLRFAY